SDQGAALRLADRSDQLHELLGESAKSAARGGRIRIDAGTASAGRSDLMCASTSQYASRTLAEARGLGRNLCAPHRASPPALLCLPVGVVVDCPLTWCGSDVRHAPSCYFAALTSRIAEAFSCAPLSCSKRSLHHDGANATATIAGAYANASSDAIETFNAVHSRSKRHQ